MNVADYIVKFLSDRGVNTIFMITGGQAMFLNDAVFRNKKIKPIFSHHEQAAGMAAEAYGKLTGTIGVAMVTAGPGAINVLSGVVGSFVDSAPMMVISGQSALHNVSQMERTKIRQYGLQGINTRKIAEGVTKYFKTVDDPAKILYFLEKAYWEATNGRTGPAWLEVPLDIQRMTVPAKLFNGFEAPSSRFNNKTLERSVAKTLHLVYKSKRPLILVGQGVRIAQAKDSFEKILAKTKIPVVTTRLGIDLIESDNPLFAGRPGLYPERGANLAVQNSDLIIALGARLDTGIVGYDPGDWGRHAKKVVVDVDRDELDKPGINIDVKVNDDVKRFLEKLFSQLDTSQLSNTGSWVKNINSWRKKYPMVLPSYKKERPINSYYFTGRLSHYAGGGDVILVDTSSCFHIVCQTWQIKKGQRFLTTGGISTMGYWVAGIGAAAANKHATIIVTGDGSLQMNVQELATVSINKLPVKIFVFNNGGYLLIRHTQKTHMEGRLMGESPKTGLWCPDIMELAKTYGIKGVKITKVSEVDRKIKEALSANGPVLCEVLTPKWQLIMPRIASFKKADGSMVSKPYEDLFPFLDAKEQKANMIAEKSS